MLATSCTALGQHFGADLYEAEISYLIDHEWAMTAQDILWRRTKRGLHLSEAEAAEVALFIEPPDAPARQKPFG